MKDLQRKVISMILAVIMLCYMCPNMVYAESNMKYIGEELPNKGSDMISIMYAQCGSCQMTLGFNNTTAKCHITITGKKDTTKISGTLKLYDNTARKNVASWSISKSGVSYTGLKTATVKKRHSYKLSFSGKIYGKNSKYGESISSSTSKKN